MADTETVANDPSNPKRALLLIDVINDFEFASNGELLKHAIPAAKRLSVLRRRLKEQGTPVIYVNDNFGQWQTNFQEQIRQCLSPDCAGREVTELLLPDEADYFVLKPKFSGFYSTSLEVLLNHLQVKHLILTGFAGDICVLATAIDAYMRDYDLSVISDCVASETVESNDTALDYVKTRLKATVVPSNSVEFET